MKPASEKEKINNTEWHALVCFCHLALKKEGYHNQAYDFDVDTIDWLKLLKLSTYHSIRPLVFQGMGLWSGKKKIPREVFEKLQNRRRQDSYTNMDHAREMVQLISLLSKEGLEIVPYKGVILAEQAYGDVGMREMSDIDFLMNLDDFPTIRELLSNRGYVASKNVPPHFEQKFFKQNFEYNFDLYNGDKRRFHVEPHWKIGFRRWQTDLGFQDIFPFTQKEQFFGTSVNMLTPEGLLLTTSLHHGGEDRWNRLKYICDVAAILFRYHGTLNWQLLLTECERLKVRNIVLLGISLASQVFKIPLPSQVEIAIQKKRIQKHTYKVLNHLISGTHSANINTYFKDLNFHLSLRQHVGTRFKVLYYHITQVFVPTVYDINDQNNKGKKYWSLFLTKPYRLWQTHIKSK